MRFSRFPRYLSAAALALLAGGLALEAYTRTADDFAVAPLSLPTDTRSIVLVFHGSEDAGDPVLAEIAGYFLANADQGRQVVNYNWSPASDNRLRARSNARRVGQALGTELALLPSLARVLLISHSAGAYVPDALCESLRKSVKRAPEIHSIYLGLNPRQLLRGITFAA